MKKCLHKCQLYNPLQRYWNAISLTVIGILNRNSVEALCQRTELVTAKF